MQRKLSEGDLGAVSTVSQMFRILSFAKLVAAERQAGRHWDALHIICVWVADGASPRSLGLLIFQYSHEGGGQ